MRPRPHREKGYELLVYGNCKKDVDEIMKNLGSYDKQYLRRRLVFVEKDTETLQSSDSKSR